MILYSLPNLSSHLTESLLLNGSPPALPELPPQARVSKAEYRKWCQNGLTQAAFVSAFEGVSPGQRIAADNPVWKAHGLIAEFDAQQEPDWKAGILKRAPKGLLPAWLTRTYSGNGRLIYEFAEPIPVPSEKWWEGFMRIAAQGLKLGQLGINFQPQETKTTQYFHIGTSWERIDEGGPIPKDLLMGWMARAGEKYEWEEAGPVVGLEAVAMEAEERFPGRWPHGWAGLALGQRGPRFWDPSANDPSACIVRERGCQCFTGDKAFVSWGEIFGSDFCRRSLDERIGRAIRNLWWTKEGYIACDTDADESKPGGRAFYSMGRQKDTLVAQLIESGLRKEAAKGERMPEVEAAILAMRRLKRVEGIKPKLYSHWEYEDEAGRRWLNNSQCRALAPHPECNVFGMGFPKLDAYFRNMLGEDQYFRLLHWLARGYRGALARKPRRGLGLFIAGKVDAGKTFFNKAIMRPLFGGSKECTAFLTGEDQFNSQFFNSPVWTIDDGEAAADPAMRRKYSERLKKVLANGELTSRAMYQEGMSEVWLGRLVVTLNTDADSLKMLPFLDKGVQDKLLILKALRSMPKELVMTDEEVMAELPYFAAYLRDLPDEPQYNDEASRYGTIPWIHPELLDSVEHSNPLEPLIELLQMLGTKLIDQSDQSDSIGLFNKQTRTWTGTPNQLLIAFEQWESGRRLLEKMVSNSRYFGTMLTKIAEEHPQICSFRRTKHARLYTINMTLPKWEDGEAK